MIKSILLCILGFLISFGITPSVIRFCKKGFGLDAANESRKRHTVPIPRLGGVPVMAALIAGLALIFFMRPERSHEWLPILLGSVLIFALGLWDDLKPLPARVKFAGQILIATMVYWMGLRIDRVSYSNSFLHVELGHSVGYAITVFWLIAIPNIINLIDGFDGLAGGLGMFMAATLGIVAIFSQQLPEAWFAFTMAGGLLGFLAFNFPPAKIFLGDGGAYLIGFSIAALSLKTSNKGAVASVLLVTIVALGVPILDTSFALARRAFRGFPIFHSDDEHIHHRLQDLGFSQRRILLAIYGVCVILSLVGLSIFWSQGRTIPIAIGVIFLLAVFAARYLDYIRSWTDVRTQFERVISRRHTVRYALLQAQLLDMEIDRCGGSEEFWPIFRQTLLRIGLVEAEDGGGREGYLPIHVKHNGSSPWILLAPSRIGTEIEWKRIAECFRPVYVKANFKWRSSETKREASVVFEPMKSRPAPVHNSAVVFSPNAEAV